MGHVNGSCPTFFAAIERNPKPDNHFWVAYVVLAGEAMGLVNSYVDFAPGCGVHHPGAWQFRVDEQGRWEALQDVRGQELVKAGVEADLHVWDGLGHAFFYNIALPESREAFQVMADFFERHLKLER
jgi:hypothetical protein